jgi:hypothetical protein
MRITVTEKDQDKLSGSKEIWNYTFKDGRSYPANGKKHILFKGSGWSKSKEMGMQAVFQDKYSVSGGMKAVWGVRRVRNCETSHM